MTTDPFVSLLVEALNLTHPRFAAAGGLAYTPAEANEPPAARKARERFFLLELYHEFRRLWDKAVPVQRGLGHLMIRADPDVPGRQPDLLFWKLGEHGLPDRRLAAVSVAFASNPAAVAADARLLSRFHREHGYPRAIAVVVGAAGEDALPPETVEGVTVVRFDTARWQVVE